MDQFSAVAGVTFWNIYFKLVNGAVRAPELVAFLKISAAISAAANFSSFGIACRPIAAAWSAITSTPKAAISSWSFSAHGPELNPVEYLWAHRKQHEMPNFCPKDFAELCAFARAKLKRTQRRKLLVAAFWKQADSHSMLLCLSKINNQPAKRTSVQTAVHTHVARSDCCLFVRACALLPMR